MLQEETLRKTGRRQYEEPDGEYIELIEKGANTITVLTQAKESENEEETVKSPPFDPSDVTVAELERRLADEDYDWNEDSLNGLLDAEADGKDRKTAKKMIKEQL